MPAATNEALAFEAGFCAAVAWFDARAKQGPTVPAPPNPFEDRSKPAVSVTDFDNLAFMRFAIACMQKLEEARNKGRGGWESPECTSAMLSKMLYDHCFKGDPRDVANLAMFLHQRGERITPPTALAVDYGPDDQFGGKGLGHF